LPGGFKTKVSFPSFFKELPPRGFPLITFLGLSGAPRSWLLFAGVFSLYFGCLCLQLKPRLPLSTHCVFICRLAPFFLNANFITPFKLKPFPSRVCLVILINYPLFALLCDSEGPSLPRNLLCPLLPPAWYIRFFQLDHFLGLWTFSEGHLLQKVPSSFVFPRIFPIASPFLPVSPLLFCG